MKGKTMNDDATPQPTESTGPDAGAPEQPARGADTLLGVLDEAAADGYDVQQIARADGEIECTACDQREPATRFEVTRERRLEGASDAADLMLVLWTVCPSCTRRGVVTLGYGPNANEIDTAVLEQIDLTGAATSTSTNTSTAT